MFKKTALFLRDGFPYDCDHDNNDDDNDEDHDDDKNYDCDNDQYDDDNDYDMSIIIITYDLIIPTLTK